MANITQVEFKKLLTEKKLVLGTQKTLKMLKAGELKKVLVTSNCPLRVQKDIEYYAGFSKTEVQKLIHNNEQLAALCKKPFLVSVIGIK